MPLGELEMVSISDLHQMNFVLVCKGFESNLIIDERCSLIEAEDLAVIADFLEQSCLRWVIDSIFFKRDEHHIIKGSESLSILGIIWMKLFIIKLS